LGRIQFQSSSRRRPQRIATDMLSIGAFLASARCRRSKVAAKSMQNA
jgi:hypothetical protein